MSDPVRYGEMQSEKLANENFTARQIVSEINKFGVNDRQKLLVIYFLALELEKMDEVQAITGFVRELRSDLFVTDLENKEGN